MKEPTLEQFYWDFGFKNRGGSEISLLARDHHQIQSYEVSKLSMLEKFKFHFLG